MSGSFHDQGSWSDNPNAPKIPSQVYSSEKTNLSGILASAICYGVVIVLFFRCINALLNPTNRTKGDGVKWLLVAHTIAMFSFVTIFTAVNLDMRSVAYINNRGFRSGNQSYFPNGPLGYMFVLYARPFNIITTLMFLLNNMLADGLLLYRCYVIYTMNYWAVALPFVMYLASLATGIMLLYYQIAQPSRTIWRFTSITIGIPYSISVSLNFILTAMIIVRLLLLRRDVRNATGEPFKIGGLYKAVVTMLSESCALYASTFLLFIGTWIANHPAQYVFFPILAQTQVIGPFLIILRVADRRASSRTVDCCDVHSIHWAERGSKSGSGTQSSGIRTGFGDPGQKTPGELSSQVTTSTGRS